MVQDHIGNLTKGLFNRRLAEDLLNELDQKVIDGEKDQGSIKSTLETSQSALSAIEKLDTLFSGESGEENSFIAAIKNFFKSIGSFFSKGSNAESAS